MPKDRTRYSNPPTKVRVGDWFAVGQVFSKPYWFDNPHGSDNCAKKYGVSVGVQVLSVMDVASAYVLTAEPLARTPSALNAEDVLGIMLRVMEKQGMPRVGWVVSESAWQSSFDLLASDETGDRGKYLFELDIKFGPMAEADKQKIRSRVSAIGLKCAFGQNEFEQWS